MPQRILCIFFFSLAFYASVYPQSYEDLNSKIADFRSTGQYDSLVYYAKILGEAALQRNDTLNALDAFEILSGIYLVRQEIANAEIYTKLAVDFSNPKKDAERFVRNLMNYANVNEYLDLEKSDSLYRSAEVLLHQLDTLSNPGRAYGVLYGNYASLKKRRGDYYGAIDYFLKYEKYVQGDLGHVAAYTRVAAVFLILKNYERAEEYILKAVSIADKHNFKTRKETLAQTYAKILIAKGDLAQAKEEAQKSVEHLTGSPKVVNLVNAYHLLTEVLLLQGDIQGASEANNKTFEFFDKNALDSKVISLQNRCKIDLAMKNYNNVISDVRKIFKMIDGKNYLIQKKDAHQLAANAYEQLNQSKKANFHLRQFIHLKDSIFQSEQISLLTSLESKFDREKKEKEIAYLDTQNQIKTVRLSQQKTMLIIGGIALALILGLLFFLFQTFQKIKSQNQIISKALNEKDTLLREIHHRVKNNLQLVSSLLGLQSRTIEDPKALDALNSGKARVRSMAIIHQDLYNQNNLTGIKVKDYLEKLCRELIATYKVDTEKINLQMEINDLNLDVDTLVPLGLIINELLTNALKYAFPIGTEGNIIIKLFEKEHQLFLEVKDDGIGIDISKISKSAFGFKLINTLLYQLDGQMNQTKGEGTHFVLSFENFKKVA